MKWNSTRDGRFHDAWKSNLALLCVRLGSEINRNEQTKWNVNIVKFEWNREQTYVQMYNLQVYICTYVSTIKSSLTRAFNEPLFMLAALNKIGLKKKKRKTSKITPIWTYLRWRAWLFYSFFVEFWLCFCVKCFHVKFVELLLARLLHTRSSS